ncbi:type VI secretion system protein TssA [Vulcaniibacterium tengchongense]|uniref:Type VI secretion system protein ImpA n=1 Tax=Vulcaniibacterium tengchongense TaxID=1273429 RepID=A0A3N4VLW5_9GAMM|nr:type VI secretion system protein TssA [Vulcaniibacterium tengchongense]RPE80251.1 type VI secretion system protein ImpA [Vulcaniibacterium tengchongense]
MLDLDALLAPVSDAAPCGEDLSFSVEFDAIQEARRADDPTLEQGEWITELKSSDWPAVAGQSGKLLQQRSKDLRLAAWWAEAQTQLQGFAGLAQGYRLVAALCDRYWEDIHPQPEDGDYEQRVGSLRWLLDQSAQWLRQLPLVQAPQGRYGLAEIEAIHARRDADAVATLDAARRATSHEFYLRLIEALPECREALQALEQSVDARLGHEGPSFAGVRDQLERVADTARRFAREAGVLVDGYAEPTPADPPAVAAAAAPAGGGFGAIETRREAIAQLRRVAEFFRRTEPHSPVAYLAEKAARWGEMPLHIWLRRVIKDDTTLSQIEELLDTGDNAPSEY